MKRTMIHSLIMASCLGVAMPVMAAKGQTQPSAASAASASTPTAASSVTDPSSALEQIKIDAFMKKAIQGPKVIDLGDQATLKLPANMKFLPKEDANTLMRLMGNSPNPERYGLIMPVAEEDTWWADLTFENSGYIKDDEAKDWDTEAMLNSLKEGNEEQNKVRQSQGLPELETHGWVEKPQYDATLHHLVWSIDAYEKNAADDQPSVNYHTFVLGRKGFISLNFIADLQEIESLKPTMKNLLNDIEFKEGQRYTDFNPATDKMAEYGIAALVGGVAAKKLGLLALLGALLAKFGKLIAVVAIGVVAAVKKLFGGKKQAQNDEQHDE